MNSLKLIIIAVMLLVSSASRAQNIPLIGQSEEFILENVKGYASVEERAFEHEEFDVLVFEDQGRELSFYFTFYRGEKVCNFIKNRGPASSMKEEVDLVKSTYTRIKDNVWENAEKTIQVQLSEIDGEMGMVIKGVR